MTKPAQNPLLLSIIIPCYNEEESLPTLPATLLPVLRDLLGLPVGGLEPVAAIEVIFVDDGSRDETWLLLRDIFGRLNEPQITFRFAQHATNRGLGAALRTGFDAAQGDVVVTTDSDGTYRFDTIPALLARLTPGVDIVTASPYAPGGDVANVPGYRLLLSRGSSLIYRLVVDWHIYCYTALFRAYRRHVIKRVPFASDGFLAGTELMVKAMLSGARVVEYPTVLHARAAGVSKAKLLRTMRAHLAFQRDVVLHRLGWRALETGGGLLPGMQHRSDEAVSSGGGRKTQRDGADGGSVARRPLEQKPEGAQ
jgi:dolichol-phosphate mannosyltransferase